MSRGAIVLCGGGSRRMGRTKAMLPFGSESMLQRVVRLLGQVVGPVVVVAAPNQVVPPLPESVVVARDRQPDKGPLEGLAVGLTVLAPAVDAVFTTGCDAPLLVPGFVDRLFALLGDHDIVVPRDGRLNHPLAAVYRTGVLAEVERLLAASRFRPAFLFERCATLTVPVDQFRDVDPELATLHNVNGPAEYLDALRRAGLPVPADIAGKLATVARPTSQ